MSKKTGFTITLEDKELNQQLEAGIKRNPEEATKAVKDCLLDLAGKVHAVRRLKAVPCVTIASPL